MTSGGLHLYFYAEVLRCPDSFGKITVSGDEYCSADDAPACQRTRSKAMRVSIPFCAAGDAYLAGLLASIRPG